jgi:hypothetical protein
VGITDRIDYALERVAQRGMAVRAIYLTEADRTLLTRHVTRYWRKELKLTAVVHPSEYRGHFLRTANRSRIYSTHGCEVSIPRRLPKVAA